VVPESDAWRSGELIRADWEEENTDLPSGNMHLWEESWDDDDTNDDFSAQLKYVDSPSGEYSNDDREELKKLEEGKK
jgi:DSS1/SEM1 family